VAAVSTDQTESGSSLGFTLMSGFLRCWLTWPGA